MMTQAQALREAAAQFSSYAHEHELKARDAATPETKRSSLAKAATNLKMARMCLEVVEARPYQVRVAIWMLDCFNPEIADDQVERGDRLLEETFELLQTMGYDFGRIAQVRDYVAARPAGEPAQEVGGVAVCLFALCNAIGVDVGAAAEDELTRISDPETMVRIRAKQAAKPKMSPLPQ